MVIRCSVAMLVSVIGYVKRLTLNDTSFVAF